MPVLRVIREYQLTSLADLFAFRYQSQSAGALVAVFMIACNLPYLALQIRAVTESMRVLTQSAQPGMVGLALRDCGWIQTRGNGADPGSFLVSNTRRGPRRVGSATGWAAA